MNKLKKLNLFAFAKLQAYVLGIIGLVCGILYSFVGLAIDILVSSKMLSAEAMSTPGLSYGTVLAFGALIGMPLIFAVGGFILGIVEAVLYNVFAKWFGCININLESN
jgi:hypothetical protein